MNPPVFSDAPIKPPPIIVRKQIKHHDAHHGGAWKVAYADFVTAMMAFFLLLWLLNVTTDTQKLGIAEYFAPEGVSRATSGDGDVMSGMILADGAMPQTTSGPVLGMPIHPAGQTENDATPDRTDPPKEVSDPVIDGEKPGYATQRAAQDIGNASDQDLQQAVLEKEDLEFTRAESELRREIDAIPELRPLQENLIVDRTPEGLRIQIVDQEHNEMFALGSSEPNENMRKLVELVSRVVQKLPNPIAITGHTDSLTYKPGAIYTNWDLSIDRANAARRALIASGLSHERIQNVSGDADTDPLFRETPDDPRNRRISFVLLRDVPLAASRTASTLPILVPLPHPQQHG